jgi:hypothetical protein
MAEDKIVEADQLAPLIQEASEICKILGAITVKAKRPSSA